MTFDIKKGENIMQLPDEFTSFWSAIVNPKTHCKLSVPEGTTCFLTNCCVDQEYESRPDSGRITLFSKVNRSEEIAIVPFILNNFESTYLDLQFKEFTDVVFYTSGAEIPLHISGYLNGDFVVNITELSLSDSPITAQSE